MRSCFCRDIGDRMIERLNVELRALAEFRQTQVRILNMPTHGQVGAIDLQDETGPGDRLVFVPHGVSNRVDVAFKIFVVIVAEE